HTAVEQRDFPEPLARLSQRNRRFSAGSRDSDEANGARDHTVDAIARVATVEYGLAGGQHQHARRCQHRLLKRRIERGEPVAASEHCQLRRRHCRRPDGLAHRQPRLRQETPRAVSVRRQTAALAAARLRPAAYRWGKWMIWRRKDWRLALTGVCIGAATTTAVIGF